MMKFLSLLGRLLDRINLLMVIIAAVLLIALTLIVGADITLRYGFNRPLGWVKETSEYILVFLGFLVAAWILKEEAHVRMDLVLTRLSHRARILMDVLTSILGTLVVLVVAWFSLRVTVDFYRTKLLTPSVLELPKWVFVLPIFVGSLLLAAQFIRRTYALISQWKALKGAHPEPRMIRGSQSEK